MNNNEYIFRRKSSSSIGHYIYIIIALILFTAYILVGLSLILKLENTILKIVYIIMGCIWVMTIIVHFFIGIWKNFKPYIIIKNNNVSIFQLPFTKPTIIKLNQIKRFSKKPFLLILHLKNGERKSIHTNLLLKDDLKTFKKII